MKRVIFLAALIAGLLIAPCSAIALTFQNSGDFASYATCNIVGAGSTCTWIDNSATCAESYIKTMAAQDATCAGGLDTSYIRNTDPNPTSYAAATLLSNLNISGLSGAQISIRLYDSSGAILYTYDTTSTTVGRYEMKMSGGVATIYLNGVAVATSGALAQNPSYVGFGVHQNGCFAAGYPVAFWDNFVMGDTETGLIFGVPAEGCYLRKDPIGGGSGLYNAANALISSFNMSATWAKKSDGNSVDIVLQNFGTGVNVDTRTTGISLINGTIVYPIADEITSTTQPYGYFVVTTNPSQGVISRTIPYQMGGASVAWGQDYYRQNDVARIDTAVSAGYWDTGTYSYQLKVTDLYGNVKQSTTINSQTQATTYPFSTADSLGVYLAWLYATKISDGTEYVMMIDTTTLNGYIGIQGTAYNATAETPLSSVNISVSQSSYSQNQFTSVNGTYNTSASIPFGTGALLTINATKSGYRQRIITFTPQTAKTLTVNIPMEPLNIAHTGIMLRGLTLDNVYSNPIASASIIARNNSLSENHTVTANPMGEYIFDDTRGGALTNTTCYSLFAVKTGYTYVSPLSATCVYGYGV